MYVTLTTQRLFLTPIFWAIPSELTNKSHEQALTYINHTMELMLSHENFLENLASAEVTFLMNRYILLLMSVLTLP